MAKIAFDFAMLSTPYRMQRCSFQMMHLAIIAERLGHNVVCITSKKHSEKHKFFNRIKRLWQFNRSGDYDIYVAKADAYYRDTNWDMVRKLSGFKVCLCNSDRTFRETDVPFRAHRGHPVQERCDLYMPCNHTTELIEEWGDKVVPATHPIDPRMYRALVRRRLYYSYLMDDIDKIRKAFATKEDKAAGFMGSKHPSNRMMAYTHAPPWCEFNWARNKSSFEYITWMCQRRACLDIRGFGDKSLRFTEAVLFGRTMICQRLPSVYSPALVHGHNALLVDDWDQLSGITYDRDKWLEIAKQSTTDYLDGWSLKAQLHTILRRAGYE